MSYEQLFGEYLIAVRAAREEDDLDKVSAIWLRFKELCDQIGMESEAVRYLRDKAKRLEEMHK